MQIEQKYLSCMNFASPYVELPEKLTVKQKYGNLWQVNNLKKLG